MRIIKSILILTAIGLLFSCESETRFKSEVGRIDSLMIVLDTAIASHMRIDTSGLHNLRQGYLSKTKKIQSYYSERSDTVQRDLALLLKDYKELKKPYKNFKKEYEKVQKELDFSKNQLYNLRHDLQNNLIEQTNVPKLLESESEATNEVSIDVKKLLESKRKISKMSEELEPKIDSVVTSLEYND